MKEQLKMDESAFVQIVELAPNVPQSEIVYREDEPDLACFKEISFELYEKYVKTGSPLEINISSKMRRELKNKMGDKESWIKLEMSTEDLCAVFDAAMRENIKLLQQSKKRLD